jgi:hypothetical protein
MHLDLISTFTDLIRWLTLAAWVPVIALGLSAVTGLVHTFWPVRHAGLWK